MHDASWVDREFLARLDAAQAQAKVDEALRIAASNSLRLWRLERAAEEHSDGD